MKNKKKLQRIVSALLLVVMALGSMTAMAANHDFSFTFRNLSNQTTENMNKSDDEQNWYVSLDTKNKDTGVANTMSDTNILGLRMNSDTTRSYVSKYHTFSNYVTSYKLAYTSEVTTSTDLYMGAKKDSSSTSSATLTISGRVCP